MNRAGAPLYTSAVFQRIAGDAWRPGGTALTRHALELCTFSPGADILDIGCGQGASLSLLRESGFKGIGLDRECSLREAFPFVQADAQNPPFPDASFHGILCECVLSLLPDPGLALRNFAALLKQGGRLLISDLFIRTASPSTLDSVPGSSCLAGARTRQDLERLLTESGLNLLIFEDHTASLKELAARLLWYGDESLCAALRGEHDAREAPDTAEPCACTLHRYGGTRYGYGLWIAEPKPQHAHGSTQP